MGRLQFIGLELLAVIPIHRPSPDCLQVFTRCDRGSAAYHGHEVLTAPDLYLEDGETVLDVVVSDPLDQSFERFGHGKVAGEVNRCVNFAIQAICLHPPKVRGFGMS